MKMELLGRERLTPQFLNGVNVNFYINTVHVTVSLKMFVLPSHPLVSN